MAINLRKKKSMNSKIKDKLVKLVSLLKNQKITVNMDECHGSFEGQIRQAEAYKRHGRYDKSVNLYLELIDKAKCVYSEIAAYLYKTVICAEEFCLGYQLISIVEAEVIKKEGTKAPVKLFSGDSNVGYVKWVHTDYREKLVLACRQTLFKEDLVYLMGYIRSMSGNPAYFFKKFDFEIFYEISEIVESSIN